MKKKVLFVTLLFIFTIKNSAVSANPTTIKDSNEFIIYITNKDFYLNFILFIYNFDVI